MLDLPESQSRSGAVWDPGISRCPCQAEASQGGHVTAPNPGRGAHSCATRGPHCAGPRPPATTPVPPPGLRPQATAPAPPPPAALPGRPTRKEQVTRRCTHAARGATFPVTWHPSTQAPGPAVSEVSREGREDGRRQPGPLPALQVGTLRPGTRTGLELMTRPPSVHRTLRKVKKD